MGVSPPFALNNNNNNKENHGLPLLKYNKDFIIYYAYTSLKNMIAFLPNIMGHHRSLTWKLM